jgi:DNA ligase (NAD+)
MDYETLTIDHLKDYKSWCTTAAKAQQDYHTNDSPKMSDYDYDILIRKLKEAEAAHPEWRSDQETVTEKVGAPIRRGLYPVKHSVPMLSLDNVFNVGALQDLIDKWETSNIATSYKYDGLACSLTYIDRRLVEAATRGDRFEGESILHNVIGMDSIPKSLPLFAQSELTVRGELLMFDDEFQRYNAQLAELNRPLAINPRNAAAGIARRITNERHVGAQLVFVPYTVLYPNNDGPETYGRSMAQLLTYGFSAPWLPRQLNEEDLKPLALLNYIEDCLKERATLPFGIDGLVFRVDNYVRCQALGYTSRAPRFAVAYKFPAEEKTTKVRNIRLQTGRTGNATPVAEVDPVTVGGVTVTNVTLHNEDHITRLNIAIGDTVLIRRAGDVVPEITAVVYRPKDKNRILWTFPTHCDCGGNLVRVNGHANHVCQNPDCDYKRLRALEHFVSRNAMDIEGLGEELLEKLYKANKVRHFKDLFCLKAEDILEVTSETSNRYAQVIIDAIDKARKTTVRRFFCALGIPNAGEGTAKRLHEYLGSFNAIHGAPYPVLLAIPDIGPIVAESICDWSVGDPWWWEMQRVGSLVFTDEMGPTAELATLEVSQLLKLAGIKGLSTKRLEQIQRWALHYGWWEIIPRFTLKKAAPLPGDEHTQAMAFYDQWVEQLHQVAESLRFVNYYGRQARQVENNQPLSGTTYVITGSFDDTLGSRGKISKELEYLGAKVSGSVSAKTTAVIVGDSPGANKLDRAKELGVPTLYSHDLRELLSKHSL